MNILFVSSGYVPSISGIAISTDTFRRSLEKLGHTVWVVAPNYPGYREHDPRVIRVRSFKNPRYPEYPLSFFRATAKLKKKFAAEKIELVHAMQPFTIGRFAQKVARHLNVPLVFTHHTRYDLYSHYVPLPHSMAQPMVLRSVRRFANQCDALIAPSPSIKQLMRDNGLTPPTYVVPTGLAHHMRVTTPKTALRRELGIGVERFVLLCVTRVSIKDKNLLMLMQAFKEAHDRLNNLQLVLVGGGPDLEAVKKEAAQLGVARAVRFVGFVENKHVARYYSAADLFVYPSVSETQGIITLEALAAGLPVVAVRAPGTSDVVTNGRNGYLTDNSPSELAQKVLELASDSELRGRMSVAALKTAEPYSAENSAKKLVAVYQETLTRYRATADQPTRTV